MTHIRRLRCACELVERLRDGRGSRGSHGWTRREQGAMLRFQEHVEAFAEVAIGIVAADPMLEENRLCQSYQADPPSRLLLALLGLVLLGDAGAMGEDAECAPETLLAGEVKLRRQSLKRCLLSRRRVREHGGVGRLEEGFITVLDTAELPHVSVGCTGRRVD